MGAVDLHSINTTAITAGPTSFWNGPSLRTGGVAKIGAPTAWAAGYTGTGVQVAVLDTGVDNTPPRPGHP